MNTRLDPRELAWQLVHRSRCQVQVAAVAFDKAGVFAWGWNSAGHGFGQCAEAHLLRRANRRRLRRATVVVAAMRRKSQRRVTSAPCPSCMTQLRTARVHQICWWQHQSWQTLEL